MKNTMKSFEIRQIVTLSFLLISLLAGNGRAAPIPTDKEPGTQEGQDQRLEETVRIERDIVYGFEEPQKQNLDIYVPKKAEKPLPLVVWIHGGGWRAGDKKSVRAMELLDKGFVVASINYRFSSMAHFPAQIHDCKAAIRWLRAHADKYNIDPNQIGVWGSSAGGHLAALLGTTNGNKQLEGKVGEYPEVSSDVQAVCDWFGPSNFFMTPLDQRGFPPGQDPQVLLFGGWIPEKRELMELAGPFTHAGKETPPFLIMHGAQDQRVLPDQSRVLHEKLIAAGADSTLIMVEGQKHGFRGTTEVYKPVEEFFERTLKKEKNP